MKSLRYYCQYFILSFKLLNKTWASIFVISLLFTLLYEILFVNIKAPFKWFVGAGKFSSQVGYGYITGYFFYFLTVFMPNVSKRIKLFRYIQNEISFISVDIQNMLIGISKGEYSNSMGELTVQEIDRYLFNINPLEIFHEKGKPVIGAPNMTHQNFYSYLSVKADEIINKIDKIITFQDVIDNGTLQYLTYISNAFNLNKNIWKGIIFPNTDAKIFSIIFMHLPFYIKKLNDASTKHWHLIHKINLYMNHEESNRQRKEQLD